MLNAKRTRLTIAFFATLVSLTLTGYAPGAEAQGDQLQVVQFNIPAGDLVSALKAFGEQSNTDVLFDPQLAASKHTAGLVGKYEIREGLRILLADANLTYRLVDGKTVWVESAEGAVQSTGASGQEAIQNPRKPATGESAENADKLDEIVVTAQKRAERLQDVPLPVTVINTEALVQNSQLRLRDYYTSIPGLNVATLNGHPTALVSIRGITTGTGTNPTVGVVVDDVPYGSSTNLGGGSLVDFDPGDLARVEVLRGPQGTLYGASSMGGLLKFVTVDPSTQGVSGQVSAGTSDTYHGAEWGYQARGSVNVPLSDTFAARLSGFSRRDPGYIDNIQTGQRGVNSATVYGGHLSSLWKPSDNFSAKFSALYQDSKSDGSSDVNLAINGYSGPPLADLQQSYLRGTGAQNAEIQAYSATLNGKLGDVDLTSLTGYNINSFSDSYDYTYALGPVASYVFQIPGLGNSNTEDIRTRKLSQEFRLSTKLGQTLDWLLGVFYTHEDSHVVETLSGAVPLTGAIVGEGLDLGVPTSYAEYAAFTNVTAHITGRFDIQFGGRESRIDTRFSQTETGPYVPILFRAPSTTLILPEEISKANAFTYLVAPRFKVSPEFMLYARLASGYRAGGANAKLPNSPLQFDPDTTQSSELGLKGDFLEHTLAVDASLYNIEWKRIQVVLYNSQTGATYITNAGRAKSQGLEFSVHSRPARGLTIEAWIAWNNAVLTQAFPDTSTAYGASGDRLPYSSHFSGNLSLEQEFPLGDKLLAFLGGAVSFIGAREGEFTSKPQRQDFPAYPKTDLRAGVSYGPWRTSLFINNLADRRGALGGGLGSFPPFGFTYIAPRMVGLSLTRIF